MIIFMFGLLHTFVLTTFYTDKWFNRLTSHLHDQVNWVFKKEMLNPLSMYKQCLIGSEKHKYWKYIESTSI